MDQISVRLMHGIKFFFFFSDPCQTKGCDAPYNVGCRVAGVRPVCICPTCSPQPLRPICASDDVQDLTECHMRQQACLAYLNITVDKQGPCGTLPSNI